MNLSVKIRLCQKRKDFSAEKLTISGFGRFSTTLVMDSSKMCHVREKNDGK